MPQIKGKITWVGETRTTQSKKDGSPININTIEVETTCYREDGSTFPQRELFDCFGIDRQQLVAARDSGVLYVCNVNRDTREYDKKRYASNRCYAINPTADLYQP